MHISVYLEQENISQQDFAETIGVEQGAVSRYVNRTRIPEPNIMQRIKAASGGLVTANDFYEPPPQQTSQTNKNKSAP